VSGLDLVDSINRAAYKRRIEYDRSWHQQWPGTDWPSH
jgi:hypothetical protein